MTREVTPTSIDVRQGLRLLVAEEPDGTTYNRSASIARNELALQGACTAQLVER